MTGKRFTFKIKKLRHYAKDGQPTRTYHGMKFSSETTRLLDRVENMTEFAEVAITVLFYLVGMIGWSKLEPVIADNLTETQRRTLASAARTLALNLDVNEHLEKSK